MVNENVKVTTKSTKAEILSAYNEVLERIKSENSGKLDLKDLKQKEVESNVIGSITGRKETLLDLIYNFKDLCSKNIDDYISLIKQVEEDYKTLQSGIEIKKKELKELTGIEYNIDSLAAIVDTNTKLTNDLKNEYNYKKEELGLELEKKSRELKEKEIELTKLFERKKENFEYDFNRTEKCKKDQLEDELKEIKNQHMEKISSEYSRLDLERNKLSEEVARITKQSMDFEKQLLEINEFPTKIEKAKIDAKNEVTKELTTKFENDKLIYEAINKSEIETLKSKVTLFEGTIEILNTEISVLQGKLNNSYMEIKQLATEALKGASDNDMFNKMKGMMDTIKAGK